MDITPASLSALYVKYSQLFQQSVLNYGLFWPKFAQLFESTTTTETHVWMDRIPQMRIWYGDRVVNNVSLRTYSLTNLPFEDTLGLDQFNVQDNKINAFQPAVQNLAMQATKWGDNVFFNSTYGAIQQGTSFVTYDGVSFFSNAHPVNVDNTAQYGTQSNYSTSFALTSANFNTARYTMKDYLGADGLPLNVNPSLLMTAPVNEAAGIQILQTQYTAPANALGQNSAGVVQQNALYGAADLLVVPDMAALDNIISTGNPWLLMDVSGPLKPFLFQLRQAPQFFFELSPQSPSIISRHQIQCGVSTRGIGGYGPYFYAYLGVG